MGSPVPLLGKLNRQAQVFGFTFSDALSPLPLQDAHGIVSHLPVTPTGRGSDLSGALRAVREKMQGQPVQAIVMLSDGAQVGGDPQLTTALGQGSAPVYTVCAAAPLHRDISIASASAPHAVLAGENVVVRVQVRGAGFAGQTIDLNLDCGDQHLVRPMSFAQDQLASVQFSVHLTEPGMHALRIWVAPQAGETCIENNSRSIYLNVVSQKIRTLLAGCGKWDYQYVVNMLRRWPWIQLSDQILPDAAAKLSLPPDQILNQDVVILSDVQSESLSAAQWQAMFKVVNERGGSVIIVPGDAQQTAMLAKQTDIAKLLPFGNPQAAS